MAERRWRLRLGFPGGAPSAPESDAAVEAALAAWRRRWFDSFVTVAAVCYVPVLIFFLLGYGPSRPLLPSCGLILSVLLVVAASATRGLKHEVRVYLFGGTGYLAAVSAAMISPVGPWAHAGPIWIPIVMLTLGGRRMAIITTVLSLLMVLGLPLARGPEIVSLSGVKSAWQPASVLVAMLVVEMVIVNRFRVFLVSALATEKRTAARLEQEGDERRRLEQEMSILTDRERRRFGQDLHDGVCQQIAGALLICQSLERKAVPMRELSILSNLLGETLEEARRIAHGMVPLSAAPGALATGIEGLVHQLRNTHSVDARFHATGDVETPSPETAQHLFRIVQEALSNARRHARASRIEVELRDCGSDLLVVVEDNGVGLPAEIPPERMGLRTMASRARLVNGSLTIERSTSGGVRVSCRVPRDGGVRRSGREASSV